MQSIASLGIWLVPIAAILVWGIYEIINRVLEHQEKLAMIERGIHPDAAKRSETDKA